MYAGLDLVGLAHGYGLPHLPKMPELKDKDLSQFTPHTTPPSSIPYRDKTREKKRKLLLQQPGERARGGRGGREEVGERGRGREREGGRGGEKREREKRERERRESE